MTYRHDVNINNAYVIAWKEKIKRKKNQFVIKMLSHTLKPRPVLFLTQKPIYINYGE